MGDLGNKALLHVGKDNRGGSSCFTSPTDMWETESGDFGSMIKIEGLQKTKAALNLLGMGEHLWVRGIGSNLIRFSKLSEVNYRVTLYSVWRDAARLVKNLRVDAMVNQAEAFRLVKKLGARPCKVVKSGVIVEPDASSEFSDRELSYQDYVNEVRDKGLIVQVNP